MTITPQYVPDFKIVDAQQRMTTASVNEQRSKFEERFQVKSSQQAVMLQKVTNKLASDQNVGGN